MYKFPQILDNMICINMFNNFMCAFLGNSVLENIYFIVEGLCKNVRNVAKEFMHMLI